MIPRPRTAIATPRAAAVLLSVALVAVAAAQEPPPMLGAEDCVRLSFEHHPDLIAAAADLKAAQSRVRTAATTYLPKGSFSQTFTHEDIPVEAAVKGVDISNGQTETTAQQFDFHESLFNFQQPLFDFGKRLDAIRSASADRDASAADLDRAHADIMLAVRRAFFTTISLEAQLRARASSRSSRKVRSSPSPSRDARPTSRRNTTSRSPGCASG